MPVSLTEINTWPSGFRCDLIVRSPAAFTSLIASIPLSNQVHEDLLQLHPVRHDLGQLRRKFGTDGNRAPSSLAAHQADHFPNHFIHVDPLSYGFALLEQMRIRLMISEARVTSWMILDMASCAFLMSG